MLAAASALPRLLLLRAPPSPGPSLGRALLRRGAAPPGPSRALAAAARSGGPPPPRRRRRPAPSPAARSTAEAARDVVAAEGGGEAVALAAGILAPRALVVCREIEYAQVFLGFEQANRYTLRDERGGVVGYLAEEAGVGNMVARQVLRTHRAFTATVMDAAGEVVFRVRRPMYLLTSSIRVEDPEGRTIGEVFQRWHPLQRNYDLYRSSPAGGGRQFAEISGGFLAWEFELKDEAGGTLALIDRNFAGFGVELFTVSAADGGRAGGGR